MRCRARNTRSSCRSGTRSSLATIGGAKGLKIDSKTGSLTPGKDADIILLDATALNVTPLNHAPGAVVTLMERSNVSTVLCAGQIKKWRGAIIGYDIPKLRAELEASRDYVFAAAGIERDLVSGVMVRKPTARRQSGPSPTLSRLSARLSRMQSTS